MLKLKAASFGVVRLQIENRILENNIKISCQPFPEKKKKKKKSVKQPDLELGGRGRGNNGDCGTGVQVSIANLPHSYRCTWPLKKRTNSYTRSSEMLTYLYTAL